MLDLRQLMALRAVSLTGSVTRAARQLGWSQPSVDYHLRNLDRLVGTPLLRRTTRGSTLTPAGMMMLEQGNRILNLSERALKDVRAHAATGATRLQFGAFPTAAAFLLPSIVGLAKEEGIHIQSTLEEFGQLVSHVNRHEYDVVLVYSVPGYDLPFATDIQTTEVFQDPLHLALPESHPLAVREPIDVETLLTLDEENWLFGSTPDDPMDLVVIDAFRAAGHELEVAFRTDDFSVMLGMIAAGMVIGLVPKMAAGNAPAGVVLRPIADPRFARSLLLAAPSVGAGKEPPAVVNRFAAVVRQAITEAELG